MKSVSMGTPLMNSIQVNCESHINELSTIWDYIGYEENDRNQRVTEISDEIKNVLLKIIERENKLRLEIEAEIESKKREIADICQILKINTYFPPRDLSSFSLLKILKEKHSELEEICNERRRHLIKHFKEIVRLRYLMNMTAETITNNINANDDEETKDLKMYIEIKDKFSQNGKGVDIDNIHECEISLLKDYIPQEIEISNLKSSHTKLQQKYNTLQDKYRDLVQDIGRISLDIHYGAETELEKQILVEFQEASEHEEDEDNIENGETTQGKEKQLTDAILKEMGGIRMKLVKRKAMLVSTCEELRSYLQSMWVRLGINEKERIEFQEKYAGYRPDTLEALQEEVKRCQQMKWEQISVYYAGLVEERNDLKVKLLLSPETSDHCDPNADLTEEQISALEHELEHMKEQYERHRELYDTVAMYQKQWLAYMDVEMRMKDPAILSNRGGILLKTEKEKKKLLKELPKTESVVAQAIGQYEKTNKTKFLVWNELSFKEYVAHLWSDFRSQQTTSKFRRNNPTTSITLASSPNSASLTSSASASVTGSPRRMSSATRVK